MKAPADFGKRIRAARAYANVSQQTLADALGIRRPTLGNWETGEVVPAGAKLRGVVATLEEQTGIAGEWFTRPELGQIQTTRRASGAHEALDAGHDFLGQDEEDDVEPEAGTGHR